MVFRSGASRPEWHGQARYQQCCHNRTRSYSQLSHLFSCHSSRHTRKSDRSASMAFTHDSRFRLNLAPSVEREVKSPIGSITHWVHTPALKRTATPHAPAKRWMVRWLVQGAYLVTLDEPSLGYHHFRQSSPSLRRLRTRRRHWGTAQVRPYDSTASAGGESPAGACLSSRPTNRAGRVTGENLGKRNFR